MIVIIKYNAGNIASVQNALNRLGYESIITDDIELIKKAKKVIFPGVGEASSAMQYLQEKGLDTVIKNLKQPVLGICLGLQLLCKSSEERTTTCLGVFDTVVKKFPPKDKVPHVGWNSFSVLQNKAILKDINLTDNVYYVHSYYAEACTESIANCSYITDFSVILHKDNFYGMQFHPEKSGSIGETLLKNFLEV